MCRLSYQKLISSMQVILSFAITTCLVYMIVIFAYYFVQKSYNDGTITKLDQLVATTAQDLVAYFASPFPRRSPTLQKLARISEATLESNILSKILVAFSDQQMITGFAILTVALVKMDTITEYHFAIVESLSVLSFVIHNTTALILQDSIVRHRMTRTWRGIAIISTMLIAIVVQIPMAHDKWLHGYGVPVKCIWTSMEGNYSPKSAVFWLILLYLCFLLSQVLHTLGVYFPQVAGGLTRNAAMRTSSSSFMRVLLFPRRVYTTRARRPKNSPTNRLLTSLAKFVALSIFILTELLYSQGLSLIFHWTTILVNISLIFFFRSTASAQGRNGNEDEWGFGQAVPMFLLIIPIATVVESAYGMFRLELRSQATIPI